MGPYIDPNWAQTIKWPTEFQHSPIADLGEGAHTNIGVKKLYNINETQGTWVHDGPNSQHKKLT